MALADKQYFRVMRELFEMPGWALLEEDWKQEVYNLQANSLEARTWDDVQRMRGKAEQLAELLSRPEMNRIQEEEFDNADVPISM